MQEHVEISNARRQRALWLSTFAFGVCFAIWVVFSIIGMKLKEELGLSDTQFGLLVATPVLTGSISRPILGIWSEMIGGRRVFALAMLVVAGFAYALPHASSYPMMLALGLGLGLAGGTFSIGVVYVSAWFPREKQGTALGLFGMGNVGAAVTSFGAPLLLAVMDWRQAINVYATAVLVTAVLFYLLAEPAPKDPATAGQPASLKERLAPLGNLQVWRFSLYYFLVFGGFVALTSWLPRYYMGVYKVDIATAGMLAASFGLPATIFRAFGGVMADRYGARKIMYISFSVCMVGLFLLSYPNTHYVIEGIKGPIAFTIAPTMLERAIVLFILGFVMSLGMAAVFKHIPTYYPKHVGSVGGVVGMIGGLGGFVLPIAFGVMNDLVGIWSSCFMLLFAIALTNLLWMHFAILRANRARHPELVADTDLPEIMAAQEAARHAQAAADAAQQAAQAAAAAAEAARKRGAKA
ncbi:MFS transporter [Thermomonas sp.]|uniref:MFS transporter n=1 Tax=Thermomonas sp. TaxID=1971895 RepID=UPI001DC8799F|nr:MFS transporter [Thermomonas sp.]MBZ0088178.1 MFS transporter [Thermomonas sp.]MCO5054124.1 MFS transporter [Thermomonas sp.]HRO62547.1 MFS transporter [Thermomonas sp.]